MEDRQVPFMATQESHVLLTKEEETAIYTALNAGWKEFVLDRPDKALLQAVATIKRKGLTARAFLAKSIEDREVLLTDEGVSSHKDAISEGWPFKGNACRLAKFKHQLFRIHWALLNSGLSKERIAEIYKQIHVLKSLDERFLQEAKRLQTVVNEKMKGATKWSDFSDPNCICDVEFAAKQQARQITKKSEPSVSEFKQATEASLFAMFPERSTEKKLTEK